MKKLTLLALSLLACSIASAHVIFEATIKTNDQEVSLNPASLSLDNTTIVYDVNGLHYKVVLTTYEKNEDNQLVTSFDIIVINNDGSEKIVATPMFVGSPASLTITSDNESLCITVHESEIVA